MEPKLDDDGAKATTSVSPTENTDTLAEKIRNSDCIPKELPIRETVGKYKLMNPNGPYAEHPAIPLLRTYADDGCPADCGPRWSKDQIIRALRRGPHISAKAPDAIRYLRKQTMEKVDHGFVRIVKWGDIKNEIPKNLKISPIAMIPHKSRDYRAILDLSFKLRHKDMIYKSVNESTVPTSPPQGMVQLGKSLKRLIAILAANHDRSNPFIFSKMDIKDGFWRMSVNREDAWNFCFVLPSESPPTSMDDIELVVPDALQMGWCESPPFFCAGTETARDIIQRLFESNIDLPQHPLEHWIMPEIPFACTSAPDERTTNLEVYVDDFFGATNDLSKDNLNQLTRAMLHGIHAIFPPPTITGHPGEDPVSIKKLQKGEGRWETEKEILGWIFDGKNYTVQLPKEKATKYIDAIKDLLRKKQVTLKAFQKVTGKLQHAAIGIPGGAGLFSPFYIAMKGDPEVVFLGKFLRQALSDWCHLLRAAAAKPTSVLQLVADEPNYIGFCDACKFGAGGVWQNGSSPMAYTVWQLEWPTDVQQNLKTADNPRGKLSINDLEMAGLVLQWLVLENIAPTLQHCHLAMFCDNSSAVQWSYKLAQSRSHVASFLLRALGLRMHTTRASPLQCLPIAGKSNEMADEASRQVTTNPSHSPTFVSLTDFFNKTFPLPQNQCWNEYRLPTKLASRVISCLRGKPLTLASWLRLPKQGSDTGTNGSTSSDSSKSTRSSQTPPLCNEMSSLQPLLLGSGKVLSDAESKLLRERSERPSPPSPRPSNWLENPVPYTAPTNDTTSN